MHNNIILLEPVEDLSEEQPAVLQLLLAFDLQLDALHVPQRDLQHRRLRLHLRPQHLQPLRLLCLVPRQAGRHGYLPIVSLIIFIFSMTGYEYERRKGREGKSGQADGSVCAELAHVAQDLLLVGEELLPLEKVLDLGLLGLSAGVDLCLDVALHFLACLEVYPLQQVRLEGFDLARLALLVLPQQPRPGLLDMRWLLDLGRDAVLVHQIFEAVLAWSFDPLPLCADALGALHFMVGLCGHEGKGFPGLLQQILIALVIHHHSSLELMVLHTRFLGGIIDDCTAMLPHDLLSPPELLVPVVPEIDRILELSLHNKNTNPTIYFIE